MEVSKAKMELAASLSQRKIRKREGLFVAEGKKCVADILPYYELKFIAALPEWIQSHPEIVEKYGDSVLEIFEKDMKKISSLTTPSDVIAVFKIPEERSNEEILSERLPDDLYLMLDSIQDPGNLGTIIRTAHWFGIKRIFASPMSVDLYNPKTVQSTMGSIAAVQVEYVDLSLMVYHNPHLPVIGLQLEGENIYTTPLPKSGFIVMGNEGRGLSPGMKQSLTIPLTIPPYDPDNHSESLNVAAAAAITISEFRR